MMVVERFVDWTVSWLPMYREAKLLLIIYLCHPSTWVSSRPDTPSPRDDQHSDILD
uniref:Uncharacterized protein n=1 Tax=Aegilops tauschii subsp. strangulata TaxID=200361 RepID=A0A453LGW6_AEGTS